MLLKSIIDSIESVAPRSAQESWDNSGMQVGDTGRDIQSVLLTTDVTTDVVDEAIMLGCQLIISHHPLLFHGLKQVCGQTPQARIVEKAIKHDIAIYSAHTSLDSVQGGINTRLADILGLQDYRVLQPSGRSDSASGLAGNAGLSAQAVGLGVIGSFPEPMPFDSFLKHVRARLYTTYIRYSLPHLSPFTFQFSIQTVALCGGSGAEFIPEAIAQGADVYLTADVKYHEFQEADGRIAIVDIDHWVSEKHARDIFRDILAPLAPQGLTCYISEKDHTPIHIY
jgi:dinuclear metal center YbgI/SA1388 family protein